MKICTFLACSLLFALTIEGGSSCTDDSSCKRRETCLQKPETNTYTCVKTKCTEPAVSGRCRAYHQRYHFDPNTFQCKMFVYGGCGQNGNNFRSQELCMKKCLPATEKMKRKRT